MDMGMTAYAARQLYVNRREIEKLVKNGVEKFQKKMEGESQKKLERVFPDLEKNHLPEPGSTANPLDYTAQMLRVERKPEKMIADIVQRMWSEEITPDVWKNANEDGRTKLFEKAINIVGQEMMLSENCRSKLSVVIENNKSGEGFSSAKTSHVAGKNIWFSEMNIHISKSLLESDDCINALATLVHEMNHIMQYDSFSEIQPFSPEQVEQWREDVKRGSQNKDAWYYHTRPTELDSFSKEDMFRRLYLAKGTSLSEAASKPTDLSLGKAVEQAFGEGDYSVEDSRGSEPYETTKNGRIFGL